MKRSWNNWIVVSGPICRQVEYIIVSNNIMFMCLLALLAYMLRMLLVLAYMLRLMLVLIVSMHVMSADANVWNFRINNQLI